MLLLSAPSHRGPDKTVQFSTTDIRAKEGAQGRSFTVRLNHEFADSPPVLRSSAEMTVEEQRALRGFDAVIYFNVPFFFQKEIVVDPAFIGWHRDRLHVADPLPLHRQCIRSGQMFV